MSKADIWGQGSESGEIPLTSHGGFVRSGQFYPGETAGPSIKGSCLHAVEALLCRWVSCQIYECEPAACSQPVVEGLGTPRGQGCAHAHPGSGQSLWESLHSHDPRWLWDPMGNACVWAELEV